MKLFIKSSTLLSDNEIIDHLKLVRTHAYAESSHYTVAAMLEFKIGKEYAYVNGVNVESHQHNRLGIHAEQNAIASAQTLLGDNIIISRAWVMGGPDTNGDQTSANHFVKPCGHCRQILLSFSTPDTQIFSITINGQIEQPYKLIDLLPQAFSDQDLQLKKTTKTNKTKTNIDGLYQTKTLLNQKEIYLYLTMLTPKILSSNFKTSPVTACIIELKNPIRYTAGVLLQDAAFLTTDAVHAALGQAITEFGQAQLDIAAIHLYTEPSLQKISDCELQAIAKYTKHNLDIHFYQTNTVQKTVSLLSCLEQKNLDLTVKLS